MPKDDRQLLRMDGWPGGINNRIRETEQRDDREDGGFPNSAYLRKALNVDLTSEGHPLRRRGYTLAEAGYAHSVYYAWEFDLYFVVINGELKVGRNTNELVTIANVDRYLHMSYAVHAEDVYFMNGKNSGKYTPSGLEVWPGPEQDFEIYDDEGLELVDNVYRTMPIGQLVESFNGRIYVAKDDEIWFSEGMSTHLSRHATNYYMMARYIRMMVASGDGIYVGTENSVIYLNGRNPFEAQQDRVYHHGVIPHAFARVPGEKFGVGDEDSVPVFWTHDGVLSVGLPGGEVRQLTRDRLAVPEHGFGAVSIREREGMSHIVSSLQKGGDANNMGASDSVVAEVRRC